MKAIVLAILIAVSTAVTFAAPAKAYSCTTYIDAYGKQWTECQ